MMNAKEESALTMCTDVDRNDKSRICVPDSVQVIGRRQIEMYSRLIHTVDHSCQWRGDRWDFGSTGWSAGHGVGDDFW
jgi:hypothetical protein